MPQRQSTSTASAPVFLAAAAVLTQCEKFVRSLTDNAYRASSSVIRGGTIGKHVRHCLDHFAATLFAFDSGETIDYDRRERGVSEETDRAIAIDQIATLRGRMESLPPRAADALVSVRVLLSSDGLETKLSSSLGREIAFTINHAIHHHAMMKAIAAEMGATCPDNFGKAPSTLLFEATSAN